MFFVLEEQVALGEHPRLYVAKWNGISWGALGTALNVRADGSAVYSAIADGLPVVRTEAHLGGLQQLYAKKWDGSRWIAIEPGIPYPYKQAAGNSHKSL
jgi:hypothetical protein